MDRFVLNLIQHQPLVSIATCFVFLSHRKLNKVFYHIRCILCIGCAIFQKGLLSEIENSHVDQCWQFCLHANELEPDTICFPLHRNNGREYTSRCLEMCVDLDLRVELSHIQGHSDNWFVFMGTAFTFPLALHFSQMRDPVPRQVLHFCGFWS